MSDDATPTWRYLVPGLLFLALAGKLLLDGEIQMLKYRSEVLTRAEHPLVYWSLVLVSGTFGVLALRKVWKRLTS